MPTQRSKNLAQKKADDMSRRARREYAKLRPKQKGKNKRH